MRLPSWVSSRPAQQPGAPGVRGLHLEPAIELHRVAHDLVGEQRVVVRVGDDRHLPGGGRERGRGGQLHRVPGQREGELGEGRELDQRLGHAPGEDLPAALVAEHVVDLLAVVGPGRHHVAHALGEREGLVDDRALGGGEELAAELGHGGDVVVGRARVETADPPGHVGGEALHVVERDATRVHLEDGRHHLLPHRDRVQPGVGERVAQRAELALHLRLHLRVGHRAPVGGHQALAQEPGQVRHVRGAEPAAEVAGRGHAAPREHADPEGEGVVVAGGLGLPVLRARELALADLEPHVGVVEIRERPGLGGDQVPHHRGDGLDQPDLDSVGHGLRPARTARRTRYRPPPRRRAPPRSPRSSWPASSR